MELTLRQLMLLYGLLGHGLQQKGPLRRQCDDK
jgi:hypothetical protein